MQAAPDPNALDAVFSALSDPTRRLFLDRLGHGEAAISELHELVDISLPAVSRHVRVLHDAGLVERDKRGRTTWIRLRPQAMDPAQAWIQRTRQFWTGALDRLADQLESTDG